MNPHNTINTTLTTVLDAAIDTANKNLAGILGLDQHEYTYMADCIELELDTTGFETVGDDIEFLAGTAIGISEAGACFADTIPWAKEECDDALNGIVDITAILLDICPDCAYGIAKTAIDGDLDMRCLRCRMMGIVHGVRTFRGWMEDEINE
jgi:hypothetical protein